MAHGAQTDGPDGGRAAGGGGRTAAGTTGTRIGRGLCKHNVETIYSMFMAYPSEEAAVIQRTLSQHTFTIGPIQFESNFVGNVPVESIANINIIIMKQSDWNQHTNT